MITNVPWKLSRSLAVALLASFALAAAASAAPLPTWDQKLAPGKRFKALPKWDNAVVLDKETGLLWERTPNGAQLLSWESAVSACMSRSIGGRKGWRLPTAPELMSLVDSPVDGLESPFPFEGIRTAFWSASVHPSDPAKALGVDLTDGNLLHRLKSETLPIVCVRSGNP